MLVVHRIRTLVTMSVGLGIVVALAYWGGTTRPGPLFAVGVAALASLVLAFAVLVAWLFHSPSPAHARTSSAPFRLIISIFALGASSAFALGFFWDELWHRRFGGFGNDFLWPPHLLIYTSIAIFALFAGGGLWFTLRGRHGTIRERLRTESHISLITLAATFLIISLPSDEIWHQIYGKDITAWSLPHITLAGGVVFITLIAASIASSITPRPAAWRSLKRMHLPDWLAVFLISIATVLVLQFGTTEWEGIQSLAPETDIFRQAFWQRPIWLYPVVVTTIALFSHSFALYTLKRCGVATCVALLVLLFRATALNLLGTEVEQSRLTYTAQLSILAPALCLDCWYALRKQDNLADLMIGSLLASVTLLIIGLPVIDHFLIYPPIMVSTIPPMIMMSVIMGQIAGWAGARFGNWLTSLDPAPSDIQLSQRSKLMTIIGLSFIVTVAVSIMIFAQTPQS